MGLFNRVPKHPSAKRPPGVGQTDQQREQRRQQRLAMREQYLEQAASIKQASAGGAAVGSSSWTRQVLAILVPPQPGYVKRCTCMVCGSPKKLPTVTAYVYCDYCASLVDYDLRRACELDARPGPEYAANGNALSAASRQAIAAGDRDTYRDLQKQLFELYVTYMPMAVSHRASNDQEYRKAYVDYMAQAAVARAFDPTMQALEAEMAFLVQGLRYGGNMLSPTIDPESFWPLVDNVEKRIDVRKALYPSAGVVQLDPDHAEHLDRKLAMSLFCQGWIGLLPPDAAAQFLDRAGLNNEYVPIDAADGEPRHCGGCGGEFSALPGAKAIICDGCGRKIDVGAAEIPCTTCGATMTLPAGADRIGCPFCQSQVERSGMR
jgi:DNA-directed RNA polymerase subunit RPC12/RpoP